MYALDNRRSQRYWIHTLIITTYCMNKRGFHFRWFCSSPTSIPLCFSLPYYPGPLRIFFPFSLVLQVSNLLSFAYLSLTSLFYTTTLRGSTENCPSKAHVYFTWLLIPKNLHYNFFIHLFKACFMPHENMDWVPSEFCLFFVALT